MSKADELLQSLTEDVPIHTHVVSDQDSYFVIDPDTRVIENASHTKNILMQYDHNSETFTFGLTRYVEGHDMTLCNRVRVHFNNVDGVTNEEHADVAELYDLAVSPADPSIVQCSWTITRQATQLVGTLNFLVQYECIDDAGNSVYEWHTDIFTDVEVRAGRNNSEQAVIEYSNVLEQWYQRIFGAGDSVVSIIEEAGAAQKEAIALKGVETLATIPADYTTTYNMAEEALRRKANAIELESTGEAISVDNSSDACLTGLKVYGKSEQGADPSPENPQEIVSVESPTIKVYGKNLLNQVRRINETISGVTFTMNPDNSITANGTATDGIYFNICADTLLQPGTYTLSGTPDGGSASTYYIYMYPNYHAIYESGGSTFEVTETTEYLTRIYIANGVTCNNLTFKPQIERGAKFTEYEPYIEPQTLLIDHTLPGIPVTKDGNYTDSDGQQWICDEIDFERGVRVQRIGTLVFDGTGNYHLNSYRFEREGKYVFGCVMDGEAISDMPVMSNKLQYKKWGDWKTDIENNLVCYTGEAFYFYLADDTIQTSNAFKTYVTANPITVQYILANPIETPLTDEEFTKFKALKTNYPNTTVLNDVNAYIGIKYVADTKTYVEHPKILLLTDTNTGVVYKMKVTDGAIVIEPIN